MNDVYIRIENLCKNAGIDITTMCREAKINRAILSEFKMGRTKELSTPTLQKISEYFSVPVDYLLTGGENKENPAQGEGTDLHEILEYYKNRPEMRMLFSVTKNASTDNIKRAAAIVEALEKEERGED